MSTTDARDAIERVIDAFEEAWLGGDRPRVEDFLTDAGASRHSLLIELAHTDLEYRLRAGQRGVVEDLGRRFPELRADPDAWRGLIAEEVRLRQRLGPIPTEEEFRSRFPDQATRLASLFARSDTIDSSRANEMRAKERLSDDFPVEEISKRYRVQRLVAEGGMAAIFRIVDAEFDRPLALKVVARKLRGDAELVERFLREARLTGQLQHPGIPPVQEKGRLEDGTPYFIMKLIKGSSLQKLLRDRSDPTDRLGYFLNVFASVCQTMGYAHSRGIIHRDLKPGNIMVGAFGEVQVMDWGLAKVLKDAGTGSGTHPRVDSSTVHVLNAPTSGGHTVAGVVMGTPGYMAPEQARGEIESLDPRCDVFGLGGILCEILTGKPTFAQANVSMRQAMMGDVSDAFARLGASGADADLIALARSCLAPDKEQRPVDAGAVAEAVARYQLQVQERLKQAELEQARLVTKAQQEKIRRRDRRILGACIAALLIAGAVAWQWHQRTVIEATVSLSQTAANQAIRQIDNAISLVDYGHAKLKDGSLDDARKTLEQAKLVADDARKNRDKTSLNADDTRTVNDKFEEYDARFALAHRDTRLAERLAAGFEGRGTIRESDFDVRGKAGALFGTAGPDIYRQAFADFGVPVDAGDSTAAARTLAKFPLREALGLALTDWMLFERGKPGLKRIHDVASAVDADPIRTRLRDDIARADAVDLVALARSVAPESLPPTEIVLLADALQGVGENDVAIDLLDRAILEMPSDFWINQALGQFLLAHAPGQLAEAVDRLESAYVMRPASPFAAASFASALRAARSFPSAERTCRRFLDKVDPKSTRVRALLADILLDQHRLAEAEAVLREATVSQPNSGFLSACVAGLLVRQGKHQDAHDIAQKTLAQHPYFVAAFRPIGDAHLHLNRPDLALEAGGYLAAWNPKSASGHDLSSLAHLARKRLKDAENAAVKAIACEPKNPAVHATLGKVLFAKQDYRPGFASFRTAAELSIGPIPEFKRPAADLARQNLLPEASWLFAEIVKRDPSDQDAWEQLIGTLQVTRETTEAREHLGPALARLTAEQRRRLDAIAPAERRPADSTDLGNRPINYQQPLRPPISTKRN